MSTIETASAPDLLDMLAEHEHAESACDFQVGFLAGLTRAATYIQDYGHPLPRPELVAIQAPILRAATVAACTTCDASGNVLDDRDRHRDHHPTTPTQEG